MNTETVPTLSPADTQPGKNHIFCGWCQEYNGKPGIRRSLCGQMQPSQGVRLEAGELPENPCEGCVEIRWCKCLEGA